MNRVLGALCPCCEAARATRSPSWQQLRSASTLQKRKPARMVLSSEVARSSSPFLASGKPAKKKTSQSPFAAMNRTAPPREFRYATRDAAGPEKRRSTRHLKGKKPPMAKEPMRALKMQQRLANVSWETRGRIKESLDNVTDFDQFDLLPAIKQSIGPQALRGMVDVVPTPIQRLAIPALCHQEHSGGRRRKKNVMTGGEHDMEQFLLAAETGSGKTLAYVLPVLDAIKKAEAAEAIEEEQRKQEEARQAEAKKANLGADVFGGEIPIATTSDAARPRAIVLLPTAELVDQVGALFKSLAHTVKFRTAVVSTAYSSTVIKNRLFSPGGVDVVVITPHLLNSIAQTHPNILSRVSHLVIDEADSLLDRSFSPITFEIIDRSSPSLQQLVFCSATIPRSLNTYLDKRYPETRRLVTPNLHAIPRRVQLSVVDIDQMPFQSNRDLACAQTIWDIGNRSGEAGEEKQQKIVVFVNEREKSIELAAFLRSKGIDAHSLSRDSDDRKSEEILASFTGAPSTTTKLVTEEKPLSPSTPGRSSRQLRDTKVLVMTDLGSRGIDTLLVRNVILYDVPHTSIDFIHRLGRVGRMGRRGRGIVLVGKNDRKDIVREVREGMFKGQALI